jgi:hypothetical protein
MADFNDVYAYGYLRCNTSVKHAELQVCVQEETSTVLNPGQVIESSDPNGEFANYGGSEGCTKGDPVSGTRARVEASVSCEDPPRSEEFRSWVWAHVWGPGEFNVTGWGVSDVRWSPSACEPSTHGRIMRVRGVRPSRVGASALAAALGVGCALCVIACSKSDGAVAGHQAGSGVSQVTGEHEVVLAPLLGSGTAGWCVRNVAMRASRCSVPEWSDGPIFTESCNTQSSTVVEAYALTSPSTSAVSVAGGAAVPTRAETALPAGLRAVWVQLHYAKHPQLSACPKFRAAGVSAPAGVREGTHRGQLGVLAGNVVRWKRQRRGGMISQPEGACEIDPDSSSGFEAQSGALVKRVMPMRGLFDGAFISCASLIYAWRKTGALSFGAAILLDAASPGRSLGPLPGMVSVRGHSGVFQAQGPGGALVARRVPGAWLVVQEGGAGLNEPLMLLAHLRAMIQYR